MHYKRSIITTLSDFMSLADEWEALLTATGDWRLFLSHTWLHGWLKLFPPNHLLVVLVRDEAGRLVGAAPLKISRPPRGSVLRRQLRQVQFIGTDPGVFDYMDFLIDATADRTEVVHQIASAILSYKRHWDLVDLRLVRDRWVLEQLGAVLALDVASYEVYQQSVVPYLSLPANLEGYERTVIRGRLRKNLNNVANRLRTDLPDHDWSLEFISRPDEIERHLNGMTRRHKAYWLEKGIISDFTQFPDLDLFYQRMLQAYNARNTQYSPGRFVLSVLKLEDLVMSYHLGVINQQGYMGLICTYYEEFARYKPGFLHFDLLIRSAIARGEQVFEFGQGDEDYKSRWTESSIPLYSLAAEKTPFVRWVRRMPTVLRQMVVGDAQKQEELAAAAAESAET
jgi:CelD/BcsL family acetyltransferase involved in cellulose biosynthesis